MRTVLIIEQHAIAINWDAEEISCFVENIFSPWHGQRKETAYEIHIQRESIGYHITVPEKFSFSVDRASLVLTIEQVITDLVCELLQDSLQIHAAVIDFQGTGVMIPGPHGSGKTTLALAALSSGCSVLTDDVAIFRSDNRTVMGFPRPFRVREDTRTLRPSVIPENCPRFESPDGIMHLYFFAPGLSYYQPNTRIRHLLFPVRRPGETVLREMGEREAFIRILPQGFNFYLHNDGCFHDLLGFIRYTQPMEILYSDHWHAIHTIKEMILREQ